MARLVKDIARDPRLPARLAALAGALVLLAQWKTGLLGSLPAPVLVTAVMAGLFLLPGWSLYTLFLRERLVLTSAELLPLSAVLSLLSFVPFALAGYFFGLSPAVLTGAFLGCVIALAAAACLFGRGGEARRTGRGAAAALGAMALAGMLLGGHFGSWIFGDFIHHMTVIRKLVEMPHIAFANYTLKGIGLPIYGHNAWYLFLAVVSAVCRLDPVVVWVYAAAVIVPLSLLAFYFAGRALFDDEAPALLATGIYFFAEIVMSYGTGSGFRMWVECANPSHIARDIVFPAALFFVLRYLKGGGRRDLLLLPLLGLLLALTHFYYVLMGLFALGTYIAATALFRREELPRLLRASAALAVLGLPYAIGYGMALSKPLVNPAFFSPQSILWDNPVLTLAGRFPVFDPVYTLGNPVKVLAVLLVPFLFLYRRRERATLYMAGASVAVLLILFDPPLLLALRPLNPAMDRIYRVVEIFPFYWIIGAFWCAVLRMPKGTWRTALNTFLAAGVALLSVNGLVALGRSEYTSARMLAVYDGGEGLRRAVRGRVPPGAVVLVPRAAVWSFLTGLPYYPVIAAADVHLPPNYDQAERVRLQERFLASPLDAASLAFLQRYGVRYLLLRDGKDLSPYGDKFSVEFVYGPWTLYRYNGQAGLRQEAGDNRHWPA